MSQQFVAGGMTKCIVDLLEPVEVQHQDTEFLSRAAATIACILDPLHQRRAIGQTGQCIVMRHMRDPGLRLPALGDIFVRGHPAAVRHWPVDDGDFPPIRRLHHMANGAAGGKLFQYLGPVALRVLGEQAGGTPMLEQLH